MEKQMYSTTLCVKYDVVQKIHKISSKYNIPISLIIRELIGYTCKYIRKYDSISGLTAYQNNEFPKNWKRIHVSFMDYECDIFFKSRARYKVSVSKLLFIGFCFFLDVIIKKLTGQDHKSVNNIYMDCYTITSLNYMKIIKNIDLIYIQMKKTQSKT